MRIKEREENMHREYKEQIRKLEGKVKELVGAMQEERVGLERECRGRLAEKERLLKEALRGN